MLFILFLIFLNNPKVIDGIGTDEETEELKYSEYLQDVKNNNVTTIYYDEDVEFFYVAKSDDTFYKTQNPSYENFKKDTLEAGIAVKSTNEYLGGTEEKEETLFDWILTLAMFCSIANFMICLINFMFEFTERRKRVPSGGVAFGPNIPTDSNSKKTNTNKKIKTFKDVAGLHEVKRDVKCLVDFIRNKEKYNAAGAELPRGVIFYGPPGTGKTLLAKAIAGEAKIPFHYMAGSDFIELYVGVGAKRVRELFERAKRDAPCIIFIDEIDAIGGRRDQNDISGEGRKTINALLSEMDGFTSADNVLVIGATNRIEDLDEALLRPGRFTNKFCIPLPETSKERVEILKMYTANKRLFNDVSLEEIAAETVGFSPAALEALVNEAAIISVQDKKFAIDRESIDKAMFKTVMAGHAKEDNSHRKKEELELVAWHEAGHALIGKLNGKKIPKVTIVASTSGAGGATFTTPNKLSLLTAADMKAEVRELYAGRVAEFILRGDKELITTGASNDIERATKIIKEYISVYGMHEHFGMLNLSKLKVNQSEVIEKEIELAKDLERETIEILSDNKDKLSAIANLLLERETIYDDDLVAILDTKKVSVSEDAVELTEKRD